MWSSCWSFSIFLRVPGFPGGSRPHTYDGTFGVPHSSLAFVGGIVVVDWPGFVGIQRIDKLELYRSPLVVVLVVRT